MSSPSMFDPTNKLGPTPSTKSDHCLDIDLLAGGDVGPSLKHKQQLQKII